MGDLSRSDRYVSILMEFVGWWRMLRLGRSMERVVAYKCNPLLHNFLVSASTIPNKDQQLEREKWRIHSRIQLLNCGDCNHRTSDASLWKRSEILCSRLTMCWWLALRARRILQEVSFGLLLHHWLRRLCLWDDVLLLVVHKFLTNLILN